MKFGNLKNEVGFIRKLAILKNQLNITKNNYYVDFESDIGTFTKRSQHPYFKEKENKK